MNLRTALFDLDGTLTDPKPGITGCIQFALARLGRPAPSVDALEWCIGPPLRDSFARLLETRDTDVLDAALGLYRERFAAEGLYENALYPGIPGALETLRANGFRTYVATSKPRVFALRILEHFRLTSLFDGVHGSELDGTRSDKADLIAHVLKVESLGPAVMIGDREHDMVGARANGLRAVGVTYGYGSAEELLASGAEVLVEAPEDLPRAIDVLWGR